MNTKKYGYIQPNTDETDTNHLIQVIGIAIIFVNLLIILSKLHL